MQVQFRDADRAETFGRLAFAYCKIATVSLLLGKYALTVAAGLIEAFFILGWWQGKRDTRCYLRYPLAAAGFWISVVSLWMVAEFVGLPGWLAWIHR